MMTSQSQKISQQMAMKYHCQQVCIQGRHEDLMRLISVRLLFRQKLVQALTMVPKNLGWIFFSFVSYCLAVWLLHGHNICCNHSAWWESTWLLRIYLLAWLVVVDGNMLWLIKERLLGQQSLQPLQLPVPLPIQLNYEKDGLIKLHLNFVLQKKCSNLHWLLLGDSWHGTCME